jgi:hypothetical protein
MNNQLPPAPVSLGNVGLGSLTSIVLLTAVVQELLRHDKSAAERMHETINAIAHANILPTLQSSESFKSQFIQLAAEEARTIINVHPLR